MHLPTKRLKTGFELPVYGLGLWEVGGAWEADVTNDVANIRAIRSAIELGITHIDTAESYGKGHSEELLGKAIIGYDRTKLLIASKVSPEHQSYDDVRRSFAASLHRLGTDYLDLYLLHRYPAPGTKVAETMRALDELVAQGAIKHIGVCNMTPRRLLEVQRHTRNEIVCNQVHYNVQYREAETKDVLAYCQQQDIFCVAWRPLQKGALLDSRLLRELGDKYNKTPAQVALNWLITQDHVATIVKAITAAHLQENLGALGWTMEQTDITRIRLAFPNQHATSDAVPLDYPASMAP